MCYTVYRLSSLTSVLGFLFGIRFQNLQTPETFQGPFQAYFGCHNFLRVPKRKTFPGMKLGNKFALSYLENIVKGQLFRISGSQILRWFFGPEMFTGLSRNGAHESSVLDIWPARNSVRICLKNLQPIYQRQALKP